MDLNLIKNSWEQASNKLSNHWAINKYEEQKDSNDENITILKSDGIIYSPTDDLKRPYPVFYLDFTLTCISSVKNKNNDFSMTINNLKQDVKPNLFNGFNFFTIDKVNNNYIVRLNLTPETRKKTDISELLNSIYDEIFPEFKKNSNTMYERVRYWNREIRNLFPS